MGWMDGWWMDARWMLDGWVVDARWMGGWLGGACFLLFVVVCIFVFWFLLFSFFVGFRGALLTSP